MCEAEGDEMYDFLFLTVIVSVYSGKLFLGWHYETEILRNSRHPTGQGLVIKIALTLMTVAARLISCEVQGILTNSFCDGGGNRENFGCFRLVHGLWYIVWETSPSGKTSTASDSLRVVKVSRCVIRSLGLLWQARGYCPV